MQVLLRALESEWLLAAAETLIDRFLAGDSRDFVLACPERKTRWSDALD